MATTPYGVRLAESAPSEMGDRSVTAVLSRAEVEEAARSERAELMLDILRGDGPDVQAHTLTVVWSREELERLLETDAEEELTISFDREQLEEALQIDADVEAHGLRQKALIFTVLVGTAAAAPTIAQARVDPGAPAAPPQAAPAVVVGGAQSMGLGSATQSAPAAAPAVVTGGAVPAPQVSGPGDIAPAVLTGGATAAADQPVPSGPGDTAPAVVTGGAISAAQQAAMAAEPPAVVTGGAAPGGTAPSVNQPIATSTPGSDSIDPAQALLIGGGAALAIAAAGFAATRRPDAPRPA